MHDILEIIIKPKPKPVYWNVRKERRKRKIREIEFNFHPSTPSHVFASVHFFWQLAHMQQEESNKATRFPPRVKYFSQILPWKRWVKTICFSILNHAGTMMFHKSYPSERERKRRKSFHNSERQANTEEGPIEKVTPTSPPPSSSSSSSSLNYFLSQPMFGGCVAYVKFPTEVKNEEKSLLLWRRRRKSSRAFYL